MTGRRLYDHFCSALGDNRSMYETTVLPGGRSSDGGPPLAWPYLSSRDKRVWTNLARRITPRKRKP